LVSALVADAFRPPCSLPRSPLMVGGGDLAGQFHDAGLLDEIIVQSSGH
jgi:dihydrofolate reductase